MKVQHKPKNIEEYIEDAPEKAQERLRELVECLRAAVPGVEESIKWSVPAFSKERILFTVAAHKAHLSLYSTPGTFKPFQKDLAPYQTSGSTIRFAFDKPLPKTLINKIAKYRAKDVVDNGAKWM